MTPVPSPNFDARPGDGIVDMLVLHYTGMESAQAALGRMCDRQAKVSAHYMIDEDGTVFSLVEEDKRAWHAGVASWQGKTDVNARSVGIELVNPGHEFGYRPFPPPQMTALADLARDILGRHPIPARNVVGHSDVAPFRKQDPGELFDWRGLAVQGIGLWPEVWEPMSAPEDTPNFLLETYGYETHDLGAALRAFQRHFHPQRIDGLADAETLGRLAALLAVLP